MANEDVSVIFGANIGNLLAGVEQAKTSIEGINSTVSGVTETFTGFGEALATAFAVEKIVSFTEHMTEAGVQLQRMEEQLGMSANEINIMSFAAENSEQQVQMLVRAFTQFSRVAEEAMKGTNNQAAAFQALGIDAKAYLAAGHSVNELLSLSVTKLSEYADGMNKSAIVSVLFGGRSAQLIHVLNELGREHDKLSEAVNRSGVTLEGFDTAASQTQEKITELDGAAKGFWERVYVGMVPAVQSITDAMTFWLEVINKVYDGLGKLSAYGYEIFQHMSSPAELSNFIKGRSSTEDDFGTPGASTVKPEGKAAPLMPDLAGQKAALAEALANQKSAMDLSLQMAKGDYEQQIAIAKNYFDWVAAHYGMQSKEAKEAATKIVQIQNQAVQQSTQRWTQFFNSFNSSIMGMLKGTTSWKDALKNAMGNVVEYFLKAGEKMIAHWIATESAKTLATQAGNTARTLSDKEAALASGGFSAAKAIKTITGDAAKAYSGTYGFLAPEMGPLAAIPAAVSFAAVMGMEALVPSFAVGAWNIPHDMVAQLHAGERVMTAHENERYSQGGGSGIELHIHGGINDAKGIRDLLLREGPALTRSMHRQATLSHGSTSGGK